MLSIVYHEIEGSIGLDLAALDEAATVADLFLPLQFAADDPLLPKLQHRKRLASCAGCDDNCCRRYAIMPDSLTVQKLLRHLRLGIEEFCKQYLRLEEELPFAEFRGRSCPFLQRDLCSIYSLRPAYCRFFLCVPASERLEKLKAQVLLLGEFSLRQYLVDQHLGPAAWRHAPDAATVMLDWPGDNPFSGAEDYRQIRLRDCCSDLLWEWLQLPMSETSWQCYADWRQKREESTVF